MVAHIIRCCCEAPAPNRQTRQSTPCPHVSCGPFSPVLLDTMCVSRLASSYASPTPPRHSCTTGRSTAMAGPPVLWIAFPTWPSKGDAFEVLARNHACDPGTCTFHGSLPVFALACDTCSMQQKQVCIAGTALYHVHTCAARTARSCCLASGPTPRFHGTGPAIWHPQSLAHADRCDQAMLYEANIEELGDQLTQHQAVINLPPSLNGCCKT